MTLRKIIIYIYSSSSKWPRLSLHKIVTISSFSDGKQKKLCGTRQFPFPQWLLTLMEKFFITVILLTESDQNGSVAHMQFKSTYGTQTMLRNGWCAQSCKHRRASAGQLTRHKHHIQCPRDSSGVSLAKWAFSCSSVSMHVLFATGNSVHQTGCSHRLFP